MIQVKASDEASLLEKMACEQAQCVPRGKLVESKDIKLPVAFGILQTQTAEKLQVTHKHIAAAQVNRLCSLV